MEFEVWLEELAGNLEWLRPTLAALLPTDAWHGDEVTPAPMPAS